MLKIRDLLPKSLFARFLLIIILPTLLAQGVAVYIFYERHWNSVSRNLASALAGEISTVIRLTEKKTIKDREEIFRVADNLGFKVAIKEGKRITIERHGYSGGAKLLARDLATRIPYPFSVHKDQDNYIVEVQVRDRLFQVKFSDKRLTNSTTYIFIMWMCGTALLLLIISIAFLYNQVKFISSLAEAASAFGKGHEIESFKPRGAKEVRQAATAFIKMKERIKRQIEQKTAVLAGVSHDLRTPLTRMKLQLALLPASDEIASLNADILEMEKMIEGYIKFSRGLEIEESQEIVLSHILESVIDNYRKHNKTIETKIDKEEEKPIKLRENALRRMFGNIIDNAFKFGKKVAVSSEIKPSFVLINIDDDGPGIPENMREEVFKPFFRIEASRNSETGGSGLGLGIARDIVAAHGGDIKLGVSPLGGLRVTIRLPIN